MILVAGKLGFQKLQKRAIFIIQSIIFRWDSLTLYDGDSNLAPMIGEYCGNSIPNNQISSTNSVLIHFESDGSTTRFGFQLEYQRSSEYFKDFKQQ